MTATTTVKTVVPSGLDPRVLTRVIEEGYGPGAWHGADLKAALEDVSTEVAFWRPSPGRHNIAEIALHHAWCIRSVRGQLSGEVPEPFVAEGEDWFDADGEKPLTWPNILAALGAEQDRLVAVVNDIGQGRHARPALSDPERFDLVLGITCHAIYHAGQVQLIKRLHAG
jgi:hypothetical protein